MFNYNIFDCHCIRYQNEVFLEVFVHTRLMWKGGSKSKSTTSELTRVIGLALSVCSKIQKVLHRTSSVTDRFPNTAYLAFIHFPTDRSHIYTKFWCFCGLALRLMPYWIRCSSIILSALQCTLKILVQLQQKCCLCCWAIYLPCFFAK